MSSIDKLKQIIEAALLAAGEPLSLDRLLELFPEEGAPERKAVREAIDELRMDYEGRGIELVEVGSGFRISVRAEFSPWVSRLWEERPPRYSRALLETLALIAYRQPITRGEIEEIRGVSVSSNIIKTLLEREWVRVVGQRDVPGRPSLYATTREFLNYFGLKSLEQLPTLQEIRDFDSINRELELEEKAPPLSGDEEGLTELKPDDGAEGEQREALEAEPATSAEAADAGRDLSIVDEEAPSPEEDVAPDPADVLASDEAAPVREVVAENTDTESLAEVATDEAVDLDERIEKRHGEESQNE